MFVLTTDPVRSPALASGWDYRVLGIFNTKAEAEAAVTRYLKAHNDGKLRIAKMDDTIYGADVTVKVTKTKTKKSAAPPAVSSAVSPVARAA